MMYPLRRPCLHLPIRETHADKAIAHVLCHGASIDRSLHSFVYQSDVALYWQRKLRFLCRMVEDRGQWGQLEQGSEDTPDDLEAAE